MRVKRLKHCKKYIHYYKTNYGLRPPFQILVDLTFCQFALTYKINIDEQVPKYIEEESNLFTTSCILEEGKELGPQLYGAVLICKKYKLRKCGHKNPVSASECILSMIGDSNAHHFIVASQDMVLREQLRAIPGVPILHIHYNALVLEKPRPSTVVEGAPSMLTPFEQAKLKVIKDGECQENRPKRRKVKGVNPLAMKRKKKTNNALTVNIETNKKSRRRKNKLSKQVKEEIKLLKHSQN